MWLSSLFESIGVYIDKTHYHIWLQSKLYIFIKEPNISCSQETYKNSLSFGAKKNWKKVC
jgi:hypothetical protein